MENNTCDMLMGEYEKRMSKYEAFSEELKDLLTKLINNNNCKYHSVSCRTKDKESLKKKIAVKNKYKQLEEITDLSGVRIITYYADEVDLIESVIKKEFLVDEINSVDKRKTLEPDRFGYLSLHYVIQLDEGRSSLSEYREYRGMKAEIQVRSILQHTWAEIEHDLGYKSEDSIPRQIERNFAMLAGLLELADKEFLAIRESLITYKEQVNKEINKKDTAIFIDKISLEAFVDKSDKLKALNEDIAKQTNTVIGDALAFGIISQLKHVGLKTISDIKTELENQYELALYLGKSFINRPSWEPKGAHLNRDIGLLYLCYALLVRDESPKKILDFWEYCGMTSHDETDNQEAQFLINAYKEFNKIANKESP